MAKLKKPGLEQEEALFRLRDDHFKKPKFYAALAKFLAAGGNPDAPHPGFYGNDAHRGSTLLEDAIIPNDLKTVKMLLDAGADPHRKHRSGQSYVQLAESQPRMKMMLEKAAGLRGNEVSLADALTLIVARAGYRISYGRFRSGPRRKALVKALESRGKTVIDELVPILLTDADVRNRSAAAESLAILGAVDALRAALPTAAKDPDPTNRTLTVRFIAHAVVDLGARGKAARKDIEALIKGRVDASWLTTILSEQPV